METIEKILSRQRAKLNFNNGIVEYFSLSTQNGKAKTLKEAINNIVKADKKYKGDTPLGYAMGKRCTLELEVLKKEDIERVEKCLKEWIKHMTDSNNEVYNSINKIRGCK